MRGAGIADAVRAAAGNHPRQLDRRGQPAHIHHIGLQHVDHMAVDHVLPVAHVAILFAAGHIDRQRVRDLPRPVRLPVGARLLIMGDAVGLQHVTDLDGALHPETAVRVDHLHHAVAQRARHQLDNLLGAARPFIQPAPAFGPDAELEGIKPFLVAQPAQPVRLVGRGDVALHGRSIGPQPPGRTTDQACHWLVRDPAKKVPQGGIDTGQRPPHIGPGEFVLALMHQRRHVEKIGHRIVGVDHPPQNPWRHLAVQHLRGDVGMIGRHLSPAEPAIITGQSDKTHIGPRECLDLLNAHDRLRSTPFRLTMTAPSCKPPLPLRPRS